MSDERKEWLQKHIDYVFAECRGYIESKNNDCLNCLEGADTCYQVHEEIKRLIQQKPEIDDIEKYAREKAMELLKKTSDKNYNYTIRWRFAIDIVYQIINDAKGR